MLLCCNVNSTNITFKPCTDEQVVFDKFIWQVYFLVCMVDKFSLTSFPWQLLLLVCTASCCFPKQYQTFLGSQCAAVHTKNRHPLKICWNLMFQGGECLSLGHLLPYGFPAEMRHLYVSTLCPRAGMTSFWEGYRIDTGPEVSLRRYFVRNFTSADVKIRHHMTPSWSAHGRFS